MQCILEKFNAYTNIAQFWVNNASPQLRSIARRRDLAKGHLVRAILLDANRHNDLLMPGNTLHCTVVNINEEDDECTVRIVPPPVPKPKSFTHPHVPVVQTHELQVGTYYKQVIGYNNKGVWSIVPFGIPYATPHSTTYPLDKPTWAGRYTGKEGDDYYFELNTTVQRVKPKTYVAKYNKQTKHVAWIEDTPEKRQYYEHYDGDTIKYLDDLVGTTCFVVSVPPPNESELVTRGPLLVGHYYSTCIGRKEGHWPDELYYKDGPLTYLGKYVGESRYGSGDGGTAFAHFEKADGTMIKHEYNYEGTTTFLEKRCAKNPEVEDETTFLECIGEK
jgi:hypothetical protein